MGRKSSDFSRGVKVPTAGFRTFEVMFICGVNLSREGLRTNFPGLTKERQHRGGGGLHVEGLAKVWE